MHQFAAGQQPLASTLASGGCRSARLTCARRGTSQLTRRSTAIEYVCSCAIMETFSVPRCKRPMCGSARATSSPWSSRTRRSTPWAAGCCDWHAQRWAGRT
eukprot:scaffold154693_cov31-Tisochrysis_lutea.AAC.3